MVISIDLFLRIFTVFLFFLWWVYWQIAAKQAEMQKPITKQKSSLFNKRIRHWLLRGVEIIMIFQVIGLQIFQLPLPSVKTQMVGFLLVLIGVSIGVFSRKTLGTNWTNAHEYQVKKDHELVTSGIYAYVRHPIYSGLCLALIGGELVAQSYLAAPAVLIWIGGYWQARQEEKLLSKHFGTAYKRYMRRTKMFIPYLW